MIPPIAGQYKIVLVGDSAVGKSSILSQFVDGKYDQHLLSTIGVDFKFRKVKINQDEIKLQIWDTAGQETFRSIVSAYYNSADAILLCYDISNYESFESLKEYWLVEATTNNKNNAKIFIIGNKLDSKREVQDFSLQPLKSNDSINGFYEVSAKLNTNIEQTFLDITKILHSNKSSENSKAGKSKGDRIKSNLNKPSTSNSQNNPAKKPCCN